MDDAPAVPPADGPLDTPDDWERWRLAYIDRRVRTWRAWLRKNFDDLTPDERAGVEEIISDAARMGTTEAATLIRKYVLIALRFRRPEYGMPPPAAPAADPQPATAHPDEDERTDDGTDDDGTAGDGDEDHVH